MTVTTTEYFGGCPTCGQSSGHINIRSVHHGICEQHKSYWIIGINLFSDWQTETEADWRRNGAMLDGWTKVEPVQMTEAQIAALDGGAPEAA